MNDGSHGGRRRPSLRRGAEGAGALLLGGALTLSAIVGAAAQATPGSGTMASPAAGSCTTPTPPMLPGAPAATPMEATSAMQAAATPMAEAPATAAPAETPVPLATPAEASTAQDAIAAATNIVNCFNSGDLDAFIATVTPNLLQEQFGASDPAAVKAAIQAALGGQAQPQIAVVSTGDVNVYEGGNVSLDLVYTLGDYEYVNARWFMIPADRYLFLDHEQLLAPHPEGDSTIISYSIADDSTSVAFDQSTQIPQAPVTMLHGINNGAKQHIFQIVALPAGAATPTPGTTPQGAFVGRVSLAPGAQEDLALVGLQPGTYVLYDTGVPGSMALLTITPPES
ncbi:MAG TPA: hypothetical protein VFQ80_11370 [Thermomicrobiales bacterium]|jgi:hypothetical protein|nr:hypothetical protein [Thermomicrobiales bacterium]